MKYYIKINTPINELYLIEEDEKLIGVTMTPVKDMEYKETTVLLETKKQLEEYFKGERKVFDLPIYMKGTPFQQKVWNALCEIPYGEIRSYKELAVSINHPKAYRAVGMANNNNPIMIIVPCHRVCGSSGKLVGYAGGLEAKEKLLSLEKGCNH